MNRLAAGLAALVFVGPAALLVLVRITRRRSQSAGLTCPRAGSHSGIMVDRP